MPLPLVLCSVIQLPSGFNTAFGTTTSFTVAVWIKLTKFIKDAKLFGVTASSTCEHRPCHWGEEGGLIEGKEQQSPQEGRSAARTPSCHHHIALQLSLLSASISSPCLRRTLP